jgi:predicted nucleic acid-binding protein
VSRLAFFDTNVIAYTDDEFAPAKRKRAISLFEEHFTTGSAVISLQVLQEYFSTATRKLGVLPEVAQSKVEILARCHIVRFETSDIIAAIELHRLVSVSFWDALILHAARAAGVDVLYSEDLQSGSTVAGVPIVNPFA